MGPALGGLFYGLGGITSVTLVSGLVQQGCIKIQRRMVRAPRQFNILNQFEQMRAVT